MIYTADFTETLGLGERFDSDELLFNHASAPSLVANTELLTITEEIITTVESDLTPPDSVQYFTNDHGLLISMNSIANTNDNTANDFQDSQQFFNDEPILLDENTVNQFLLPVPASAENMESNCNGPDLLSLFSCVICHDIFTKDSDLLDHTILMHATDNNSYSSFVNDTVFQPVMSAEKVSDSTNFDVEWLVCCICMRILSTALEHEPSEQLCCIDTNGKSRVAPRKLSAMFVCEICNYLFADGEALDCHKQTCCSQTDHENGSGHVEEYILDTSCGDVGAFQCNICGLKFNTQDELQAHSESHRRGAGRGRRAYAPSNNNTKMWNCGSCNQLFSTARELYRHKRGEDRPPGAPAMSYACEECDKQLGSMCALHTHKKMHKVSKPGYPCRICGRRFNQSGHLAIHMRMHTGERPYPCDLCPKAFKVKVERDDHRRTHTGERPFACAACPKTFTAAARLREHARIHTDQRPYRCDICGAAFRRPYARTVHTLIHTGQKPHECSVCGTAFRRSGDMWKHKRTLHGIQSDVDTK